MFARNLFRRHIGTLENRVSAHRKAPEAVSFGGFGIPVNQNQSMRAMRFANFFFISMFA